MTSHTSFLRPAQAASRTPVDILIVEDHVPILTVLMAALVQQGYSLRSAENGRKAMALLGQHEFRLLITDIYMPEMDGFELIAHHKAIAPDVPILTISGGSFLVSHEENLKTARILGSLRTLSKPFSLDEFLSVVRELLDTAQQSKREA